MIQRDFSIMSDKKASITIKNKPIFKIFNSKKELINEKKVVTSGLELFCSLPIAAKTSELKSYSNGFVGWLNPKVKDGSGNFQKDENKTPLKVVVYPSNHRGIPTKIYEVLRDFDENGVARESQVEVLRLFYKDTDKKGKKIVSKMDGNNVTFFEGKYVSKENSKAFREKREDMLDSLESMGLPRSMKSLSEYDKDSFVKFHKEQNDLFRNGEPLSFKLISLYKKSSHSAPPDQSEIERDMSISVDFFSVDISKTMEATRFKLKYCLEGDTEIQKNNGDIESFIQFKLKDKLKELVKTRINQYAKEDASPAVVRKKIIGDMKSFVVDSKILYQRVDKEKSSSALPEITTDYVRELIDTFTKVKKPKEDLELIN
jgi:hypothetical protein